MSSKPLESLAFVMCVASSSSGLIRCSNLSTQVLLQILNFASVLSSGLMIYKGLGLITNTESPIVVVLRCVDLFARCCCSMCAERVNPNFSGSMEPAFYRGDILFLINPPNMRYEIGDITVYKIPGQDIPIVHRILETHDVVKAVNGCVVIRVTCR